MPHAAVLMLAALAAAPSDTSSATATLPLSELMPLMKEQAERQPPVGAVISSAKLEARTRGQFVDVTATLTVDVMAEGWQSVGLFGLGPGVAPGELPALVGGTLGVNGGGLRFFSRIPGRHAMVVKLVLRGVQVGERYTAKLDPWVDMPPVQLEFSGDAVDAAPLYVSAGQSGYELRWNVTPEVAKPKVVARPPLEPSVTSADARFVTTLEGKGQLTVTYGLRLDRAQTFQVELPRGYALTRLKVNELQLPVPEGEKLALEVAPRKVGDDAATVELSLSRELGVFHLSGALELKLPAVGWPISELRASTFLPAVFTWKRSGGSLEPAAVEEGEGAASGLPGRKLAFRQFLVSGTAPTLELDYAVDLEGKYFRVREPVVD